MSARLGSGAPEPPLAPMSSTSAMSAHDGGTAGNENEPASPYAKRAGNSNRARSPIRIVRKHASSATWCFRRESKGGGTEADEPKGSFEPGVFASSAEALSEDISGGHFPPDVATTAASCASCVLVASPRTSWCGSDSLRVLHTSACVSLRCHMS